MTEPTDSVSNTDAANNPNLNIADLVNVLQVFRTCAQRGAFRADEMTAVGGLYDRLQAFLVATGAVKLSDEESGQEPAKSAQ